MKKYYLIFCFFLLIKHSFPQDYSPHSISVNLGNSFTKFYYRDSKGNSDPNMSIADHFSYGLGYNFMGESGKTNIDLCFRTEIAYKQCGANSSVYNQKLSWLLGYLDFNVFIGVAFPEKKVGTANESVHRLYGGIAPYYSRLIVGEQSVGANFYNLITENGIKKDDYGLSGRVGFFWRRKFLPIFFEIRLFYGLNQLELNSEPRQNQKLHNMGISFNIGIGITTKKNSLRSSKNRKRNKKSYNK